jgi:hypothetical protein
LCSELRCLRRFFFGFYRIPGIQQAAALCMFSHFYSIAEFFTTSLRVSETYVLVDAVPSSPSLPQQLCQFELSSFSGAAVPCVCVAQHLICLLGYYPYLASRSSISSLCRAL